MERAKITGDVSGRERKKVTEKKILLFGFQKEPGQSQAAELRRRLRPDGIRIVQVDPADYLKPIGTLAGVMAPGAGNPAIAGLLQKRYSGTAPLPVRLVVIMGVTDQELDGLLRIFPECGITKEDLKAVLTPMNASWNAIGLCRELLKEHRQLHPDEGKC